MAKTGRFITLEGGEGTGKSTQAKRLAAALVTKKIATLVTREPGGSPGAEQIRRLLVEGEPGRWEPLSETLMMFAARAAHVVQRIEPSLARGEWVLCDRFTDATRAYQGAGRGIPSVAIESLAAIAHPGLAPDLTLLLDLPPEAGLQRVRQRQGAGDRFEDEALHMMDAQIRDDVLSCALLARPEHLAGHESS